MNPSDGSARKCDKLWRSYKTEGKKQETWKIEQWK